MIHFILKALPKQEKLLKAIESALKERKIDYQFHFSTSKQETISLAELCSREKCAVVAVGGDGTLNDVLHGLHPENAALGLIPAGTGNDFAASAQIPKGLAALELILSKEPKTTDYIQFSDGRRSLNIAGVGIDVDILQRCERKKSRGKSKYFFSLLRSLSAFRGMKMKLCFGEKTYSGNFLIAAVCNGKQFGSGIPICPPAKIDDGVFNVVYADCPSPGKIPFALIKLMRGKVLSLPFAHMETCEKAEFSFENAITAQYDGELYPAESFCAVLKKDLKFFRG